jgi:hypothetical protein
VTDEDLMQEGKLLNFDGAISDDDLQDYMETIFAALDIHLDRERIRQGLWKQYTARDQCNPIKFKIDRVLHSLGIMDQQVGQRDEAIVDNAVNELYDIINYANFAVRKLQGLA